MNSAIIALQLNERDSFAPNVQEILTDYGDNIKTRLGLHNDGQNQGLILVQFAGSERELENFEDDLRNIGSLNFKAMELDFRI